MSDQANGCNLVKLVVLGAGGVGKSAITIRLVCDNWLGYYDPTIEDSYRRNVLVDDQVYLLDILDTAGQDEFSAMQDDWMRQGQGFLLVYSVTHKETFDEVKLLRDKILRAQDKLKVPIVLAGNKCDLEHERQVLYKDGKKVADEWGVPFFETSAKMKINNEACFFEIVREIRRMDAKTQKPSKPINAVLKRCTIL